MTHRDSGTLNRRNRIQFERKHRKWPLGTVVQVKTKLGYLTGRVFKHWRFEEVPHGCSVEFDQPIDLGRPAGYKTYCHILPFRSLRKVGYPCM